MDDDTIYRWADGVVQEDLGDSIILGDGLGSSWLVLSGTAIDIWRLLQDPHTLNSLIIKLNERYESTPDRMRADVISVLTNLSKKEFLQSAPSA